jgi:hypothetical protein
MTAADNGRWLGVIGLLVGIITGGLGSAAIGNYQYQTLNLRLESHTVEQQLERLEVHERLATIEAKLDRIYQLELDRDGSSR